MFFTTKFIFNGTNWFKSVRTGTYCPSSASFIGISSPLTGSIRLVGSVEVRADTGEEGATADGDVDGTDKADGLAGKSSSSSSATVVGALLAMGTAAVGATSALAATAVAGIATTGFLAPRAFLRVDSWTVVMIAAAAWAAILVVRLVGRGLWEVFVGFSTTGGGSAERGPPSFSWNNAEKMHY